MDRVAERTDAEVLEQICSPDRSGRIGGFDGPLVRFSVHELTEPGGPEVVEYAVKANDGATGLVCRIPADPKSPVVWHGAWKGDQWCPQIEALARKRIAHPVRG